MDTNTATTVNVEQTSEVGQYGAEYRIWINGSVRGYLTGSREQAEAEAARIVRGIEADRRWFARNEVLDQSGLSADLIAKMKAATAVSEIRCYQHPESPTGYIGRGHWCEHKRAQLASR